MKRNGCKTACKIGSEMCVECQETKTFKEGFESVVLLHNKVGAV